MAKKKYMVRIPWNCTFIARVYAENEDDAKDRALACGYPGLCHQCSEELEIDEMNESIDIYAEEI